MGAGVAVGVYDVRFNRDVIGDGGWLFADDVAVTRLVEAAEADPERCAEHGAALQAAAARGSDG